MPEDLAGIPAEIAAASPLIGADDVACLADMYDRIAPIARTDTAEVNTACGATIYLGAQAARRRNGRHWCFNQFNRIKTPPTVPDIGIAVSRLAARDLAQYVSWVPASVEEIGPARGDKFTACAFAAVVLSGHRYEPNAIHDLGWAWHVCRYGGYIAATGLGEDAPEYTAAINALFERWVGMAAAELVTSGGGTAVWQRLAK